MDKINIDTLVAARDKLVACLKIHELRGDALQKKLDDAVVQLKKTCPHTLITEKRDYYEGGYDYAACTIYSHTCSTCQKVVKRWEKSHGYYG